MINKDKIIFNEQTYYAPNFGGVEKITIIELLNDNVAFVRPYKNNEKNKPHPVPIAHIYNTPDAALKGRRAWEQHMRNRKRGKKR